MPTITLRFKDVKIKEYPIAVGQTCTIGRKHSNDIVIDHPTVSGSHAQIESLSTAFILRDLGSTNGTYIDNEKVTLHHLRHNDEILIGNHKLVFDLSDINKTKQAIEDDYQVDKTRILPRPPWGRTGPPPPRPGTAATRWPLGHGGSACGARSLVEGVPFHTTRLAGGGQPLLHAFQGNAQPAGGEVAVQIAQLGVVGIDGQPLQHMGPGLFDMEFYEGLLRLCRIDAGQSFQALPRPLMLVLEDQNFPVVPVSAVLFG
jgi:pSer/pThr/pTyr-binding forkhead associated (FHA) protein